MFTTTNVAATAASAGGGPVAAAVPPTFQIISTTVTGPSSSSSSSTTSPAWRLTPTSSSSLIKQPSVVSIINGNMNVTSSTSVPINSTGVTIPTNSTVYYIKTTNSQQHNPITTGNLILQSPQTVRLVSTPLQSSLSTPTFTRLNNSNTTIINNSKQILTPPNSSSSNNFKPGICIDTPILGRLAPITIQPQITTYSPVQQFQSLTATTQNQTNNQTDEQTNSINSCLVSNDNNSLINNSQDQEIEIFINNVVCSFALCCKLDLRKIAKEAANVIYKREQAMVLMKIRNPNCSANIWSSGKVTVTGTTSDDDARRGARRIARLLQRLGFRIKFRHYRVVNCLASCLMPWPIDIIKLSRTYPEFVSYEPEIHPGATVRLPEKAVLKVFTTGSVTLTAPSVERINTAVNEIYPQLFECRKINRDEQQC
jgi:transcription initiation factor TFIID TATA-box-binding protein